ncbi:uncharacterized protein LOC141599060 [Silene latifolia]|uniref:uncharacterized protein LOC141599060 n=1 Tax=Silene latifolia TaxID=37657 RepID=UPI003D7840A0
MKSITEETANQPFSDAKHRLDQASESQERPSKIAKLTEEDEEEKKETMVKGGGNMQRYLVAIEYIGTRFSGSQQQLVHRTVVGVLQEAFKKFVGQPVSIFCSSRTDAGVHALSNVCHVDVERISKRRPGEVLEPHEPATVQKAVNHYLQKEGDDVKVIDVRKVPSDFHARYRAQERTYYYRLLSGPDPLSTFEKDRGWHVPEELDLRAMQDACKILAGHHDFSSFRAAGCQASSSIRTLDEFHVLESTSFPYFPSNPVPEASDDGAQDSSTCLDHHPETDAKNIDSKDNGKFSIGSDQEFGVKRGHRCLIVKARARSFLYHQVRLLVGVLKCVGTGHLTVADVERILNAKDVAAARPMAPACGLYLGHVKYDL